MKKREGISIPIVGVGSLLATFAVLCLTVFALLQLSTIRAEEHLADAAAEAVSEYYLADYQAEQIFAQLRRGELPEGVTRQENRYSYQCPISENQYLQVILEQRDEGWQVLCWQAVTREDAGETDTLPVWQGAEKEEAAP